MEINKFAWIDIEKDGIGEINPNVPILICYIRPEYENQGVYGLGRYDKGCFYIQGVSEQVKVIAYANIPEFSGERPFAPDSSWMVNKHLSSAILAFKKVIGKIKLSKKQEEHCSMDDFINEFLKNEA